MDNQEGRESQSPAEPLILVVLAAVILVGGLFVTARVFLPANAQNQEAAQVLTVQQVTPTIPQPTAIPTPTLDPNDFMVQLYSINDWVEADICEACWGGVNDLRFDDDTISMAENPLPDPGLPNEVIEFTVNTNAPRGEDHNAEMILDRLQPPDNQEVYFGGWVLYPEDLHIPEDGWFLTSEIFSFDRPVTNTKGPILALFLNDAGPYLEPAVGWYPDHNEKKRSFFPVDGTVIERGKWTHIEFKYRLDPENGGVVVWINGDEVDFRDENGEPPTALPTLKSGEFFSLMFNLYTNKAEPAPARIYLGPAHISTAWHGLDYDVGEPE